MDNEEEKTKIPQSGDLDHSSQASSSSSSFFPIDHHVERAIQLIDENKSFSEDLLSYIEQVSNSPSINNNYHIISVFGSQSTGKSTLLNRLFNTSFDVMDESNRQQTTKGIWIAHSPLVTVPSGLKSKSADEIFVIDVEGSDGRERGEDQDFERKAALFALSTSEILIVNIWETQVGLYHGANMSLLKTVFEVNLSLFGKAKLESNDHKVLLLFIIRDHVGVTPLANLADTLTQDMNKLWESLNKAPELSHLRFEDFFDLGFHALGHKVLQEDKFNEGIRDLGRKIVDSADSEYLFKKNYHHNIPIDGWTIYARNCWDQIDNNKDLDLPTQQILVARFKCDEILNSIYDEFMVSFNEKLLPKAPRDTEGVDIDDLNYEEIGKEFEAHWNEVLNRYDTMASRYNTSVYEQKRSVLSSKVIEKLSELIGLYLSDLTRKTTAGYSKALVTGRKKFADYSEANDLRNSTVDDFFKRARFISHSGSLIISHQAHQDYINNLQHELDKIFVNQQRVELDNKTTKILKKFSNNLRKVILQEIGDPKRTTWDVIFDSFKNLTESSVDLMESSLGKYEHKYELYYGEIDFLFAVDHIVDVDKALEKIKFKMWTIFYELSHKYISKDIVLNILKDRFDDVFRYDENGLPRLHQDTHEVERNYGKAKENALKVLPIYSIAKLSDGTEILPDYDIFDKKLQKRFEGAFVIAPFEEQVDVDQDDSDDDSDDERKCFAEILSESEKSEIVTKFKKDSDAKFVETKRSIIQHVTQIPYYIYLIILVLGWNEFMAIVRNPFFFSLLLLFAAGFYVLYQMNLLRPTSLIVQRMIDEALVQAKRKLKELVIDEHDLHANALGKMSESAQEKGSRNASRSDAIELDDLASDDKN
ncbi:Piso0_000569 [Millerozyma farinosa CBS 7064]|uniref:Piso0_000569 protein n=1 Tax=Pichia sorbitophila (strain ATCC MYA-4447 / BCRC 22081 / CBS 7064 / NBRC 10061 / NRRL Y-12695) TaxID=559304 RepID=G8YSR1_PICSO|nr:Piso0_000569 [Millerozyma farinosa CBS 7064]CCE73523.1 Piso0_000569 [Millerozyma farinosa CBS 7064]